MRQLFVALLRALPKEGVTHHEQRLLLIVMLSLRSVLHCSPLSQEQSSFLLIELFGTH